MLCRGFGFKLLRDGNDDGMEFSKPRTYQSDQMLSALVDNGVGMVRNPTPSISSYHSGTAGALENINQAAHQLLPIIVAKRI